MRKLEIYRNGDLAGYLVEHTPNNYVFEYLPSYFHDHLKPAVSLTLPKSQQVFHSPVLFPFFYNMLSEGVNRQLQSRMLKIDEDDYVGLLAATAQFDTIGAVTVKPLTGP